MTLMITDYYVTIHPFVPFVIMKFKNSVAVHFCTLMFYISTFAIIKTAEVTDNN